MGEVWSMLLGAGIGVVVVLAAVIAISIKLDKIRENEKIKEQLVEFRKNYMDELYDVRDQIGLSPIAAMSRVIVESRPTHLRAGEGDLTVQYLQREFDLLISLLVAMEAKVATVSDPTVALNDVLVELREEVAELRTQLDAQA